MRALAIALGIVLVAGVGWLFMSGDDESTGVSAASDDQPSSAAERRGQHSGPARDGRSQGPRRDGSLEQRVARLEDEVAMLRRQLAVRGRVALSGQPSTEDLADDPVLDDHVRGIVEDERERERERRNERRAERFEEIREEALDELVRTAGLTEQQRESIDGLWTTEAERIVPLIAEARAGERSFREIREELEGFRKQTDEAVAALLSDTQYETYEELRPRGPGRRRGQGRDGGPPAPPPGG